MLHGCHCVVQPLPCVCMVACKTLLMSVRWVLCSGQPAGAIACCIAFDLSPCRPIVWLTGGGRAWRVTPGLTQSSISVPSSTQRTLEAWPGREPTLSVPTHEQSSSACRALKNVDGAHLMNGSAVPLVHLVKLVDAADALVCQHQRAALQHLPAGRAAVRQPHHTWLLQWLLACSVLQHPSLHEGCSAPAGPTQPVQGSSVLQPECIEPGLPLWAHAGPCSAVAGHRCQACPACLQYSIAMMLELFVALLTGPPSGAVCLQSNQRAMQLCTTAAGMQEPAGRLGQALTSSLVAGSFLHHEAACF